MEFKYLFYIILAVIFVGSKIFQGIKKANEEVKERQRQNERGPRPQPQQPAQAERIPDPWAEPKPQAPQPPKQKTIEEILAEMTRQYDQPTAAAPTPQAPAPKPAPKRDQLNQPYPTVDTPYSKLDKPTPAVKKNYRFDDNMAMSSLTKADYTNILEEHDTLDDDHGHHNHDFNPREAFKYATLLERKFQ